MGFFSGWGWKYMYTHRHMHTNSTSAFISISICICLSIYLSIENYKFISIFHFPIRLQCWLDWSQHSPFLHLKQPYLTMGNQAATIHNVLLIDRCSTSNRSPPRSPHHPRVWWRPSSSVPTLCMSYSSPSWTLPSTTSSLPTTRSILQWFRSIHWIFGVPALLGLT